MDKRPDPAVSVVHDFIGGAVALGEALTALAELATAEVGADMAGLTLLPDAGRPKTVAYTDRMVTGIDESQYESDRGPCLQAFRDRRTVVVVETTTEERWPEFGATAAANGIRTSMSIPIVVGARGVGALNFYAAELGTFDDEAAATGTMFARHVATVAAYFDRAEEADNLQRAMESRAEIEQAKGILMAATGRSADEAFDLLRQQSQTENRKLRDIAAELVARQRRASP